MKFCIHTTGCKANQWDSYIISNRLKAQGLVPGPLLSADIIVINACTLTDGAEKDIRRFMNHCRSVNKDAVVVLAGCHAQHYPDNTYGADLILGHGEKFQIEKFLDKRGCFVEDTRTFPVEESIILGLPSGRTRFFFKIQDGCDRFCRYCVVPYARGMPRSRSVSEIIEVLSRLKEKGVQEVVLTGIEISGYKDRTTGTDLKGLLCLLESSDTPLRIRMSSIDPTYIDEELTTIIARSKKIAKSLHISLQSGSDRILEMMGRRYTRVFIKGIVERLIREIRGIGIGMDVMVGFPTEDDDAFMETYDLIGSLNIFYLHVFPFSARKGTAAAFMKDDVQKSVKKKRVSLLKNLDATKRLRFYKQHIGTDAVIIPEGKVYNGLLMKGYTDNYLPVYIPYKKTLENKSIRVKIQEIKDGLLYGELEQAIDD